MSTDHASMNDLRRERFDRPDFTAADYDSGREEAELAITLQMRFVARSERFRAP